VERVAAALGEVEAVSRSEQAAALAGKVVPLLPVPKLSIAIDAIGVPVVPRETAGRPGKDETGPAKTHEAKLACLFTQTRGSSRLNVTRFRRELDGQNGGGRGRAGDARTGARWPDRLCPGHRGAPWA